MADTRGYRLAVGPDGQLYFAGETAGGNTIFRYDGRATETQAVEYGSLLRRRLVQTDSCNTPYLMTDAHVAYVARLDPGTGTVQSSQMLIPRLSGAVPKSNSYRVRSLGVDDRGRVMFGGRASF
jgi:hypothetical protein